MNDKLEAAIAYLRDRKKYIFDAGCKFKPTNAAGTDVAQTVRLYLQDTQGEAKVKLVKGAKK